MEAVLSLYWFALTQSANDKCDSSRFVPNLRKTLACHRKFSFPVSNDNSLVMLEFWLPKHSLDGITADRNFNADRT